MTASAKRTLGIVVGGTAALHAGVFLLFAWFVFLGWMVNPHVAFPSIEEAAPAEDEMVVIVEPEPGKALEAAESPVPAPKAPVIRYVRTDPSEPSTAPPNPGTASFISDRNSLARSEAEPDPAGEKNMPSQNGLDVPVLDLVNRQFADGEFKDVARAATGIGEGEPAPPAQPPSAPMASESVQPENPAERVAEKVDAESQAQMEQRKIDDLKVEPIIDPSSDLAQPLPVPNDKPPEPVIREPQWEKLMPPPPKAKVAEADKPRPMAKPDNPAAGTPGAPKATDATAFQTQTTKNKLSGAVTSRGKASVDAADTPMGRYMAKISAAVAQKFHPACAKNRGNISHGWVEVEFDVNRKGVPENLRITDGSNSNAAMKDLVLGSILDAKIPPMPSDLEDYLIGGRLHVSHGFLFH